MFRFKLGLGVGIALGWLIGSGKAVQLLERFRAERSGPTTDAPHPGSTEPGVTDIGSLRHTG